MPTDTDTTTIANATIDARNHPLVPNTNAKHAESLGPTEKICKRVADATGSPVALGAAVILQFIWIGIGVATKWDPFPFVFLLTCSNVVQLILIFVLAVGQRQSSSHAEMRAQNDHDSISRLVHHQELQESILLALAQKIDIDTTQTRAAVEALARQD